MLAPARTAGALAIVEAKNGAVRGADQLSAINQEVAWRVVQATALVGAGVAPGEQGVTATIEHDRLDFAADHDI
jgi:hypothetical protein